MARTYAKFLLSAWSDDRWVELSSDAKLVYWTILSQPKMRSCGVIDLAVRRWAPRLGISEDAMDDALTELVAARFVAIDRETDELAVRTFAKHDAGDTKNWKVWRGVWGSLGQVESAKLRRFVAAYMPASAFDAQAKPLFEERPSDTQSDWSSDDGSDDQSNGDANTDPNTNAIGSGKSLSVTRSVYPEPPPFPIAEIGGPPQTTAPDPEAKVVVNRVIQLWADDELARARDTEIIDHEGRYLTGIRRRLVAEKTSDIERWHREHPSDTPEELWQRIATAYDLEPA